MLGSSSQQGCFFEDKKRRVDFVIIPKEKQLDPLGLYIRKLESVGLQFEVADGQTVDKKFILIHMPIRALRHFARVYNVGLEENKFSMELLKPMWYTRLFTTPISHVARKEKGEFTSVERIIIIKKLLESTVYDVDVTKKGISQLIRNNLVENAYPLHDGPIHFDPLFYTNDRQSLFHHWSIISVWYKELPLDMIHRYFGCEIAFYFAWLEFFNYMLVPPAILGSVVVIINLLLVTSFPINQITEVCTDNDMWICPTCEFGKNYCTFRKLSSFCYFAKYNYVFDNYITVGFAIFMSFWATFFIHGWRRKENKLKLRWDVQYQNPILDARLEYKDSTKRKKLNVITGKLEPYVPTHIRYWKMTLSVSVCLFMIFLVMAGVFGIVLFKIFLKVTMDTGHSPYFRTNSRIYYMLASALANVVFIKAFSVIYGKLSIWLTDLENPRTQHDYDNSYLYKKYLLSFGNNYLGFFYDAFLMGRFYTLPDRVQYLTIIERDTCQPLNCIFIICMSMGFLLMLKKFAINVLRILIPNCRSCYRKLRNKHEESTSEIPQYEEEYKLLPTNRFFITANFSDMVISYGHVTFFVAAFPLAPLCVLLNNLLEVRIQAEQLVTEHKRPVPKIIEGVGPWNAIMSAVTYLSIVTNAFVIAFTSSFIEREYYQARQDYYLRGYVNSTLSAFATADYPYKLPEHSTPKICYFRARRHPPDHPLKYHLTRDYWIHITWKLICVLIFEYALLVCNKIMGHLISDIPQSVEEQLVLDRELAKEAKEIYQSRRLLKSTRRK